MDAVTAVAAVRTLLDLLYREAPASEFERAVVESRAAGADGELLAELDAARSAALRLRDVLREGRRRETELAALNDTAGGLATLRDVDAVLRAIVHRARALLGTDTAYLSLFDPIAGDTYLRVTAGSVSPRFQRLRMAKGEGVGGLVAERGTPFVTADYFADDSFRHTTVLDEGVRDEGLVAMLAVPLAVGDTMIGVLWVSDRRPRLFRPGEVSLLTSLAAHAAVAIDNANLLSETRSASAELAEANSRERAHAASVERAAAAHDRLTGLVLDGAGLDDVVRTVAELVGGEAAVVLGDAAPDAETADAEPDFAAAHARALDTGRRARVGAVDIVPVVAGAERFGVLVRRGAVDEAQLSGPDTRILERAATTVALLLLFRRSLADAEHRLADELVREILTRSPREPASLVDRAARLSVDLNQPYVAVVVHAPGADRTRLASAAGHLAATAHGLAGVIDGRTVLLLPGEDASAKARRAAAEIGFAVGRPATAGAAGPAGAVAGLAHAYAEACRCVDALTALGRCGEGASAHELGFLGLLLAHSKDVAGFVGATLGPLLDYDEARGAELVQTVAAYFDSGRNMARTRDLLHIHINTVAQRLDRVASLLGADWREPSRELQIRLALHLHPLLPN